jgi:uncharacterized protein YkwD
MRFAGAAVAPALIAAACSGSPSAPSPAPGAAGDAVAHSTELRTCIQVTNLYRASVGKVALTRSATLDEYAAAAARTDGTVKIAHHHARTTNLGNGTSRAENAILWWSLRYYGTVESVVRRGLEDMWRRGAGGTHYQNIVGGFTETGCGIFVNGDEVTVVQAFR